MLSAGGYLKSMYKWVTLRVVWCVYIVIPPLSGRGCVKCGVPGTVSNYFYFEEIFALLCSDGIWQQPLITYCNIFKMFWYWIGEVL